MRFLLGSSGGVLLRVVILGSFLLCSQSLLLLPLRRRSSYHHRHSYPHVPPHTVIMEHSSRGNLPTTLVVPSTVLLRAKASPSSQFNLQEIEAFEEQLEQTVNDENMDTNELLEYDEDDDTTNGSIQQLQYIISDQHHNQRLDTVLSELLTQETSFTTNTDASSSSVVSRSFCGSLISQGCVSIKEEDTTTTTTDQIIISRKSFRVEKGQHVIVKLLQPHDHESTTTTTTTTKPPLVPQDLPLDILYEDDHMIVIHKAAGMVVHPAVGNWDGTVVNALAYYLMHKTSYQAGDFVVVGQQQQQQQTNKERNDTILVSSLSTRPGIVHRLDKGTSGVLVVAKTIQAHATLQKAFADRSVKKTYLAVTIGNPCGGDNDEGNTVIIDKPIGRHPVHRQRMRVVPDHTSTSYQRAKTRKKGTQKAILSTSTATTGRRAISIVDTIASNGKLSFVRVRIETGRTHQIRVHLQDRHTPIYGDDVYGLADWNKRLFKQHQIQDRPLLHAYQLELDHPVTGERMSFTAPLANDMLNVVQTIYPQIDATTGLIPRTPQSVPHQTLEAASPPPNNDSGDEWY